MNMSFTGFSKESARTALSVFTKIKMSILQEKDILVAATDTVEEAGKPPGKLAGLKVSTTSIAT